MDHDYVLGTHDEEIARLGLQHRVWRPRVLEAWRRAGISRGQTVIDAGCGPGWASLDLAEVVGPDGRVLARDRSERFIEALTRTARARGLSNIDARTLDLDLVAEGDLPAGVADAVWCRWVLAFVTKPRDVLTRIHAALKPGGVFVAHEYVDYASWRLAPRSELFEEFVRVVMASWRENGGEPDIGLSLPRWLGGLGFTMESTTPLVDYIDRADPIWAWPRAFVEVGLKRLVELERLSVSRADEMWSDFLAREAEPHTRMVNPIVAEIVARRS